MKKEKAIFLLLVFLAGAAEGQQTTVPGNGSLPSNPIRCLMLGGYAGLAHPSGKLAEDYGSFGEAGGSIQYLSKSRLLLSLDGGFLFGGSVKKDPVPNLRNPDGTISGSDGRDAVFKVFQRGSTVPFLRLGYLFKENRPFKRGNRMGGYSISAGAGWLRHFTYIQDISKKTAQFSDQYRIGYDRLATGPSAGLWLGYLYLADHNRLNLQLELGYLAGFTQTARYNFVSGIPAGTKRRDDLIQLRLRLYFTVRSRDENASYYY
jgi:hypothetical protein